MDDQQKVDQPVETQPVTAKTRTMGQYLLELRYKRGLTRPALALEMGLKSPQSVFDWEAGRRAIPAHQIAPLCRALRVRPRNVIRQMVKDYRRQLLAAAKVSIR